MPVPVSTGANGGLFDNGITQVAAGSDGTVLAVDASQNVYAWGNEEYAQFGRQPVLAANGQPENTISTPYHVKIPLFPNEQDNVTAIAEGGSFSLALTASHQIWAWGYNGDGELGDGSTTGDTPCSPRLGSPALPASTRRST